MNINWKKHTEAPAEPCTALIATAMEDDGGKPLFYITCACIFTWHGGQWINEITGEPVNITEPFYWLPEGDLMATLESQLAE